MIISTPNQEWITFDLLMRKTKVLIDNKFFNILLHKSSLK